MARETCLGRHARRLPMLQNYPGSNAEQSSEPQLIQDELHVGVFIGRIYEGEVEPTRPFERWETSGQAALVDFSRAFELTYAQIFPNHADVVEALLDEQTTCRTARQSLNADRPRARKKIQEACTPHSLAEDVEKGLTHSVGRGTQPSPPG